MTFDHFHDPRREEDRIRSAHDPIMDGHWYVPKVPGERASLWIAFGALVFGIFSLAVFLARHLFP